MWKSRKLRIAKAIYKKGSIEDFHSQNSKLKKKKKKKEFKTYYKATVIKRALYW